MQGNSSVTQLLQPLLLLALLLLQPHSCHAASSEQSLREGVANFLSKFPKLQQMVQTKETSTEIKRITSRGFTTFSQTAALQAVDAVEASQLNAFAEYIIDALDVASEARTQIKRVVFDLLPFTASQDWQDFKLLFRAGRGGQTKYVNILANRDSSGFNFVIADFQTKFSLAPDLLVVRKSKSSFWGAFGSSSDEIRYIPASITDADLDVLMTFFDLAAFRRFAQMLQVPMHRRQRRLAALGYIAVVQAGIKTYQMFAKAFATKKTSRIVGKIIRKGFDYFEMSSRTHVISGMDPQFFSRFSNMIPSLYGIPQKYHQNVQQTMLIAQFTRHQDWNKNDFLFDVNDGGKCAWVTILSNRNQDGTYNFIVANVKQKFKLAANFLIIEKSKSVAGGIYQSQKTVFKRMPRSITEADLESLINFFNIITFKRLGRRFSVDTSKLDP